MKIPYHGEAKFDTSEGAQTGAKYPGFKMYFNQKRQELHLIHGGLIYEIVPAASIAYMEPESPIVHVAPETEPLLKEVAQNAAGKR
jgi:hypothetical protein